MSDHKNIIARVEGHAGVIELDRPKALNSLTPDMIDGITQAVSKWENDDSIEVVIIRSTAERAFCAGGDVRGVRETDVEGNFQAGDEFFRQEHALNLQLAEYNKPIVALMEGVCMGGGFGISAHGSHRVITPRTLGAMPETAIGFLPDVGMSYALTHLDVDPAIGLFIGCTGWRLSPADMLFTGLGNVLVDDANSLAEQLPTQPLREAIQAACIDQSELDEPQSVLEKHQKWIVDTFADGSWVDIERRIAESDEANGEVSSEDHVKFLRAVRESLATANPSSLVATVEVFRRSAQTDLSTALQNELAVGGRLRREGNFAEGVRAVLVDKDRTARFDPAKAEDVDPKTYSDLLS